MRFAHSVFLVLAWTIPAFGQAPPAVHLWYEPEWFEGVRGSFGYWTGTAKATGAWGVAGPGISAEWSQGGESEWNSMGAAAEETNARCHRAIIIPREGLYKVWVRYVDHRHKREPFRVQIEQAGKTVLNAEMGVQPVVPANDEYQLFWGFSFGWGVVETKLAKGSAKLSFVIDQAGEAWRQVDAILITEDLRHTPVGREKPAFAFHDGLELPIPEKTAWRGQGESIQGSWKRPSVAGRDFSLWTGIEPDAKWWGKQNLATLPLYDIYFHFSPPSDIRDKFHQQFAGKKDLPLLTHPDLLPGFYLGNSPDLSPESPVRQWLERTKTPFYVMTNYATGAYTEKSGPATYAALTGPLANQFLGYIHGEAVGTTAVSMPEKALGATRRSHADALIKHLRTHQADAWSKIYKTNVAPEHRDRSIPCLSTDALALAHLFHESGSKTVGYEIDATNVHVPMRIAFERGAARQYGGAWINYASGNFGDACNYFTQNPVVPRGAPAWFHSRYTITDGVSISWYRKLYYLNYLGGASAIYWEQNLTNQWMLPGPGTHPIQLSPFGRATEDFMAFTRRLPDRGEPYTPVALLLSAGHGYDRVNYHCKMLGVFTEDRNDIELRELFNVCWHPASILEGMPASPDVQSMPSGVFGDIFDVLVDRPSRAKALLEYPVVWAAGDVNFEAETLKTLQTHLDAGGTLVLNVNLARQLPKAWLGFDLADRLSESTAWSSDGQTNRTCVPFQFAEVKLGDAQPLAWTGDGKPLIVRNAVGRGAVIVTLMPHNLGLDERAHPALAFLMKGLTRKLLPIEINLANGQPLRGEVQYAVNRTKDGWLVALYNHRGLDKTQNGIARVDRRAFADVELRVPFSLKSVKEWTSPRDLERQQVGRETRIPVRIHAGDVQVIGFSLR